MELILPYYKEYINTVASFVEEMGISHGAGKEEQGKLRLLGEETFVFIMNGIPKVGLDQKFHLRCIEEEDGLLFLFSNHGRPLNARMIPDFEPDRIDETLDALSLSMVRSLSQEFSFRNLGNEGWELIVRFKIMNYKQHKPQTTIEEEISQTQQEAFTVRKATTADVPGIIDLVYNTYRYSYAKEAFYNDRSLTQMIENKRILSLVAVTESGKVVGHNAVLLDSDLLGEAGMSMVDPAYRKSKVFILLVINTKRTIGKEYPNLLVYAKCVTSHERSQAFVSSFTPCLLQLSVYKHASFIGIDEDDVNKRESLIYSISNSNTASDKKRLFVPEEHLSFINLIMSDAKLDIELNPFSGTESSGKETRLHANNQPSRQYMLLEVEQIGDDFGNRIRQETILARQKGAITVGLFLPTNAPASHDLDAVLTREGYFFSGIKPIASGEWMVVYTNLLYQPFDFDKLKFFDSKSKILSDYVASLYKQL